MPEVRQSSFALLGDLTKACYQHVKPYVGRLFDTSDAFMLCFHAAKLFGKIALAQAVYSYPFLHSLVCRLSHSRVPC